MTSAALLQMRSTVADLTRLRSRVGDIAVLAALGERRCEIDSGAGDVVVTLTAQSCSNNQVSH